MLNVIAFDPETYRFLGVLALFFLILLLVRVAITLSDFSLELRRINNEIRRTTSGERNYWIREKRRLWLSLLPFVNY